MVASRVAVVGAGLAGLAAGVALADAGFEVELFERGRLLGGRATSFEIDGVEVDNGQHVFLGCCTEFVRFVDRVGMSGCLRIQDRFDALVLSRRGASRLRAMKLPAPWHLLGSFLGYRHLAWPDKVRLARALRAVRSAATGETFAQWLVRQGQSEDAMRSFWRPFFIPALNAPLEEVSAEDGTFVLSQAFLANAQAARFGFATVPLAHVARAAAERLARVHLSTGVSELAIARNDERIDGVVLADGKQLSFDAVVLAVAPPQLAHFASDDRALGVPGLAAYKPYPIVDVHVWHDRGGLGFDFAALLDSPVQWVFEKRPGYLCCSISDAQAFANATTAHITEECWREVSAVLPGLAGATLVRSAVTRNPEATYLAPPGAKRPGPGTRFSNLAIAGSWTDTGWPDTMESAVRSGAAAARLIADARGGVARVA